MAFLRILKDVDIESIKRSHVIETLKTIEHQIPTLIKAKGWINKIFKYALQLEIVENNPVTSIDNSIVFKKASKVIHQPTLLENDKIKEYILALKNSDLKKHIKI